MFHSLNVITVVPVSLNILSTKQIFVTLYVRSQDCAGAALSVIVLLTLLVRSKVLVGNSVPHFLVVGLNFC
jgi:hypothetical protein